MDVYDIIHRKGSLNVTHPDLVKARLCRALSPSLMSVRLCLKVDVSHLQPGTELNAGSTLGANEELMTKSTRR